VAGSRSHAMASELREVDSMLQAKVEEKREFVQTFIRSLEKALANNGHQDRQWLRKIIDPSDPCFQTLIKLLIRYKDFVSLRCVALRAVQIILRIATQMVPGSEPNVGMRCLKELAGEQLASEVFPEILCMAERSDEPHTASNAFLVLAELGPKALAPRLMIRLLDMFVALPERADDLVEVALRVHSWGGKPRDALLGTAVAHPGGKLLCEVLLQVINRADAHRRMRAVKVLAGCLLLPNSEDLLYTNDIRVLVEILLRELPNHARDAPAFACHADCFKALTERCEVARSHRHDEVLQLLEDLQEDERNEPTVRTKCAEVLQAMARDGGA
jgi:hypothetical protein